MTRAMVICFVFVLQCTFAASASAIPVQEAVRLLNIQRADSSLPADLVADPVLTLGCANHLRYLELNGPDAGTNGPHGESKGLPGYTPEGADSLGEKLGPEDRWTERVNPWLDAPLHEYDMMHPRMTSVGYATLTDSTGSTNACLRVRANRERGPLSQFMSYPGPGGTTYPERNVGGESPYAPQQLVGIPQGVETGPTIHLYPLSHYNVIKSATMVGPDGPVEVRPIDYLTPAPSFRRDIDSYLVVPKRLRSNAVYEVRVVWGYLYETGLTSEDGPGLTREQRFRFRTSGRQNWFWLGVEPDRAGMAATITVGAVYHPFAPDGVMTLTGPGGKTKTYGLNHPERFEESGNGSYGIYTGPLDPGSWRACSTSGGGDWERTTACVDFEIKRYRPDRRAGACRRARSAREKARRQVKSARVKLRAAKSVAKKRRWRRAVKRREVVLQKAARKARRHCNKSRA